MRDKPGSDERRRREFFKSRTAIGEIAAATAAPIVPRPQPIDLASGRSISPIVAAALCIKPRCPLTANQAAKVDAMKKDWLEFAAMRRLAMRFRGLLKSKSVGMCLKDAQKSGLYAEQRFARTLQRDIDTVRNAVTESWSNGQTEGQINRLKALTAGLAQNSSGEHAKQWGSSCCKARWVAFFVQLDIWVEPPK